MFRNLVFVTLLLSLVVVARPAQPQVPPEVLTMRNAVTTPLIPSVRGWLTVVNTTNRDVEVVVAMLFYWDGEPTIPYSRKVEYWDVSGTKLTSDFPVAFTLPPGGAAMLFTAAIGHRKGRYEFLQGVVGVDKKENVRVSLCAADPYGDNQPPPYACVQGE